EKIKELNGKLKKLPFIDDFDLKYNNLIKVPSPSNKAVMFCVMDVSGSMTQEIKDMAKRFFILLYLFLQRNYKQIEVVFIRHHTAAKEVDEDDFFYSRETGGTIVSSALEMTRDIINNRYNPVDWNIYVAQASDGDNWEGDSSVCSKILTEQIMSKVQYFSYVEITDRAHQNLWREYESIAEQFADQFAMQQIKTPNDIYPVFRRLFEKKETV
ncbi:YeaH/YhbH family protein, partial [Endozoicomonas sp. SESOKO4]